MNWSRLFVEKSDSNAPLFSIYGLILAAMISCLLCWPIYLTGEVYLYPDTEAYLRRGAAIWEFVSRQSDVVAKSLGFIDPIALDDTALADTASEAHAQKGGIRSIVYSAFASAAYTIGGPLGVSIAQGTFVIFASFALIDRAALATPGILAIGLTLVITLTTLPWHTVYLMPDVLGAVVLIYGAVLVCGFDTLSRGQKLTITALAAVATATHYGNGPLMLGVAVAALGYRTLCRKLTFSAVLACVVVVSFGPLVNLTISTAMLDTSSVTPRRFPVLIARSIDDGPARWYLEGDCKGAEFTVCSAFAGRVPKNLREFLWSADGISSLSADTMRKIRAEEGAFLIAVLKEYPVAQARSLGGNAVSQVFKLGTGEIRTAAALSTKFRPVPSVTGVAKRLVSAFDPVTELAVAVAAAGLLLMLISRSLEPTQRAILYLVIFGLLLNASIFGGLSAPAERYQARVAWLLPLLLVVFAAQVNARRRAAHVIT